MQFDGLKGQNEEIRPLTPKSLKPFTPRFKQEDIIINNFFTSKNPIFNHSCSRYSQLLNPCTPDLLRPFYLMTPMR